MEGNLFQWKFLLRKFFDFLLVFGPNLAFVGQIQQFRSSKSNEGFSKKISLFLLLANIFRIFFWYGKRFDYTLLIQSIVSICMQLFLLYECLKVSPKPFEHLRIVDSDNDEYIDEVDLYNSENQINEEVTQFKKGQNKNHTFLCDGTDTEGTDIDNESTNINSPKNQSIKNEKKINYNKNNEREGKENVIDLYEKHLVEKIGGKGFNDIFDPKMFWEWPYLIDYIFFLVFLSIIILISFSVFGFKNDIFIESLGYIGMSFESLVGIPQIIQNCVNKSTKNLSFYMIAFWLTGDSLKTLYFLQFKSPIQFVICGLIQMILDCVIIFQMNYYKGE